MVAAYSGTAAIDQGYVSGLTADENGNGIPSENGNPTRIPWEWPKIDPSLPVEIGMKNNLRQHGNGNGLYFHGNQFSNFFIM